MSKVQGHCGTVSKGKIKQQSFSFEKCCSSGLCRNRPQSLVRLMRRKELIFSRAHWNQRSSLKQIKVMGKNTSEPTTHIILEKNNTSKWKWALPWTCNHTPPILNIQTPRAISSNDLQNSAPYTIIWSFQNVEIFLPCASVKKSNWIKNSLHSVAK